MRCRVKTGLACKKRNKNRILCVIYLAYGQANVNRRALFRSLVTLALLASLRLRIRVMPHSQHFEGFDPRQNLHDFPFPPSRSHSPGSRHILSSGKEVATRKSSASGIHGMESDWRS